jgi:hypothetical protein
MANILTNYSEIDVGNDRILSINATGGIIVPKGTTSQRPTITDNPGLIRYNTTTNSLEFFVGSQIITFNVGGSSSGGGGTYVLRTGDNIGGTLKFLSGANIELSSGDIILSSGNIIINNPNSTIAGRKLISDGNIIDAINSSNGFIVRTNNNTFTTRYVEGSNTIDILNANGINGNPQISLKQSGVSEGTYTKLTVDLYGRITTATNLTSIDIINMLGYTPINNLGDTMNGILTLSTEPTDPLHAATKKYVDNKNADTFTSVSLLTTALESDVQNQLSSFLPLSGGTLTGSLKTTKLTVGDRTSDWNSNVTPIDISYCTSLFGDVYSTYITANAYFNTMGYLTYTTGTTTNPNYAIIYKQDSLSGKHEWLGSLNPGVANNQIEPINATPGSLLKSLMVLNNTGLTINVGNLTLVNDPTSNMHASTKQYVDTQYNNAKSYTDNSIINKISKSGDTMTGNLVFDTGNLVINTGFISKTTANGSAVLMQQDGSGRQHWYWNTYGGSSPSFSSAGEDASDIMQSVTNNGSGGYFAHRSVSGVGKNAGDPISWTTTLYCDLNTLSYKNNIIYHAGNVGSHGTNIIGYTPINKSGDVMSGLLTLSGDPTSNMHASTKQYVDNNIINSTHTYNKAQRGIIIQLSVSSIITPDFDLGNFFEINNINTDFTLKNPSNLSIGQSGFIRIVQDSNGTRRITYDSFYKFPSGADKLLSTAAGSIDILAYYVTTPSEIACSLIKGLS